MNVKTSAVEIQYIPVDQPGYRTVSLRDGKPFLNPVICWELILEPRRPEIGGKALFVYPVTPDGSNRETSILYPDGTVHNVDATYDSLQHWLQAQLDHAEMIRRSRLVKERGSDQHIGSEELL